MTQRDEFREHVTVGPLSRPEVPAASLLRMRLMRIEVFASQVGINAVVVRRVRLAAVDRAGIAAPAAAGALHPRL
jgi:hypothetical protein